jgi:hypothetical protein
MDMIMLIAGLVAFAAGLASAIFSAVMKSKYKGIGAKEFISSQYMLVKVPFGGTVSKKLLVRRMDIKDLLETSDMPNWISIMLSGSEDEKSKMIEAQAGKTETELLEETKKLYATLQSMAERVIVGYQQFKAEWMKVDPDYDGKLRRETLDFLLQLELSQPAKYIKKKISYSVLRLLVNYTNKNRQAISRKKA